jgi:flagellar protein FliS
MALTYQNQMNQYRRMKIETASPEMLILMLYEGAIKNIVLARDLLNEKNKIDACSNAFIKAQNIIAELMSSLNFEIGGDIAKNLFNIYEYINYTLAQANVNKNDHNLEAVMTMLKELRDTWQEVIRINREKYPNGIPRPTVNTNTNAETDSTRESSPTSTSTDNSEEKQKPAVSTATPANNAPTSSPYGQNRFKQIYGKNFPRKP